MRDKIFSFLTRQKYLLSVVALNILVYIFFIAPLVINKFYLPTDAYRDIAYARGVLYGNPVFADPTIKGEFLWYPPLNPLLMALFSRITAIDLFKLYAYSPLYIMFFIPILFYLLLARIFGKKTGLCSVILIPIMPWLATHIFTMPMPSTHAFVVILVIMIFLLKWLAKGLNTLRSVLLGILMGLAFLHHSLSALLLYGAVFLLLMINRFVFKKAYRWQDLLLILLLPLVIWSPYLLPNLLRPKLNPEPLRFMSDDFKNPAYALFIPNQYTFLITGLLLILGIKKALQFKKQDGYLLILCLLAITAGGQLLAYLKILGEKYPGVWGFLQGVPYLIPHEFQWFFQLFALPLIVTGMLMIFKAHPLFKKFRFIPILLVGLFILPAYLNFPLRIKEYLRGGSFNQQMEYSYLKWLRNNTPLDAVCLTSQYNMDFFFVQAYTARKVVCQFKGHLNFNVNFEQRDADRNRMLFTAEPAEFMQLAKQYSVNYLVIDPKDLTVQRLTFFNRNFPLLYTDPWLNIRIFGVLVD